MSTRYVVRSQEGGSWLETKKTLAEARASVRLIGSSDPAEQNVTAYYGPYIEKKIGQKVVETIHVKKGSA